jgi:hypothetical protein
MALTRVKSVKVADKSAEYLLLKVYADREDSPKLTLSATEGVDAYAIYCETVVASIVALSNRNSVKRSDIDKSRSSSSKVSAEEWRAIVDWLLLHKPFQPNHANLVNQTELVCTVETSTAVTLVVRQNIGGITVRIAVKL